MSKLTYSADIDEEVMQIAPINTRVTDINTYVNTTKIGKDAVAAKAVESRNMKHCGYLAGTDFLEGAAIGALTGVLGWHATNVVVAHTTALTEAVNRNQGDQPVVQVVAEYEAMYWAYYTAGGLGKQLGIGFSTAGAGGPFGAIVESARPFGYRATTPRVLWTPAPHYYTGVAGWMPYGAYNGKKVRSIWSFGGLLDAITGIDVSTITHYALMIYGDNTASDIHPNDKAYLYLTARENG